MRLTKLFALGIALVLVGAQVVTAITTTTTGKGVTQVKLVGGTDTLSVSGSTTTQWTNLPGVSTSVSVGANTRAIVRAEVSGFTQCRNTEGSCDLRVLIGGVEGSPAVAQAAAYGGRFQMERWRGPLNPGTYVVQVQVRVPTNTDRVTEFVLWSGWTLSVERIAA